MVTIGPRIGPGVCVTWHALREANALAGALGEAPVARWIELQDSAFSSSVYLVCASPISGNDKLRHLLWDRASGMILMSATLTPCGTFDFFLHQSGLSVFAGMRFLCIESPFDYRSIAIASPFHAALVSCLTSA